MRGSFEPRSVVTAEMARLGLHRVYSAARSPGVRSRDICLACMKARHVTGAGHRVIDDEDLASLPGRFVTRRSNDERWVPGVDASQQCRDSEIGGFWNCSIGVWCLSWHRSAHRHTQQLLGKWTVAAEAVWADGTTRAVDANEFLSVRPTFVGTDGTCLMKNGLLRISRRSRRRPTASGD